MTSNTFFIYSIIEMSLSTHTLKMNSIWDWILFNFSKILIIRIGNIDTCIFAMISVYNSGMACNTAIMTITAQWLIYKIFKKNRTIASF